MKLTAMVELGNQIGRQSPKKKLFRGGAQMSVLQVYNVLKPQPPELLNNPKRQYVRQGVAQLWSDADRKNKPRFAFSFLACLPLPTC